MKLLYYIRLFYKIPNGFKKLLILTAWHSFIAEINLKLKRSQVFQVYHDNLPETLINNNAQRILLKRMNRVMDILERRAPWKPMCYNRALTAKRLLRARGIETTLHIGFKARQADEDFEGHAWLTIHGFFITGRIPQLNSYKKLKPIKE